LFAGPIRSCARRVGVREEGGDVGGAELREVRADRAPEELHAVLDALRPPGLVHLVGDVRLEPQREDLHVERLAVALARLARADRDAALLGLADLPDEVTAVVAARRAAHDLEVLRLQLLDGHRREPSARRLRGVACGGRRGLRRWRRRLARARVALRRRRGLRVLGIGRQGLLDALHEELLVRALRALARRRLEALP